MRRWHRGPQGFKRGLLPPGWRFRNFIVVHAFVDDDPRVVFRAVQTDLLDRVLSERVVTSYLHATFLFSCMP